MSNITDDAEVIVPVYSCVLPHVCLWQQGHRLIQLSHPHLGHLGRVSLVDVLMPLQAHLQLLLLSHAMFYLPTWHQDVARDIDSVAVPVLEGCSGGRQLLLLLLLLLCHGDGPPQVRCALPALQHLCRHGVCGKAAAGVLQQGPLSGAGVTSPYDSSALVSIYPVLSLLAVMAMLHG